MAGKANAPTNTSARRCCGFDLSKLEFKGHKHNCTAGVVELKPPPNQKQQKRARDTAPLVNVSTQQAPPRRVNTQAKAWKEERARKVAQAYEEKLTKDL